MAKCFCGCGRSTGLFSAFNRGGRKTEAQLEVLRAIQARAEEARRRFVESGEPQYAEDAEMLSEGVSPQIEEGSAYSKQWANLVHDGNDPALNSNAFRDSWVFWWTTTRELNHSQLSLRMTWWSPFGFRWTLRSDLICEI